MNMDADSKPLWHAQMRDTYFLESGVRRKCDVFAGSGFFSKGNAYGKSGCYQNKLRRELDVFMSVQVAVIMGSKSDWETMKHACEVLDELEIGYEKRLYLRIAHRI